MSSSAEELRPRLEAAKAKKAELEAQAKARADNDGATDDDVLRLERRVEELKETLQLVTGRTATHVRAAEDYAARGKDLQVNTHTALERAERAAAVIAAQVKEEAAREAALCSPVAAAVALAAGEGSGQAAAPAAAVGALASIATTREAQLSDVLAGLRLGSVRSAAATARLAEERGAVERLVPAIDEAAQQNAAAISGAWEREKAELRTVHERLLKVNKEHQFHLQRGTHVKPAPVSPAKGSAAATMSGSNDGFRVEALSSRHAQVSNRLVKLQGLVAGAKEDVEQARRQLNRVRADGRDAAQQHEEAKADVAARLAEAVTERAAAQDEAVRFRDLRAEMQHALMALRENPSATVRRF